MSSEKKVRCGFSGAGAVRSGAENFGAVRCGKNPVRSYTSVVTCHQLWWPVVTQGGLYLEILLYLEIDLFRSYNSFSQRVCCYVDVMLKIWNEPIFWGLYLLTWPVILTLVINEKKLYLICMVCKKKLYLFYIKSFNFDKNLFGKPLWFLLRNL